MRIEAFSAALCRGLIEARSPKGANTCSGCGFSAALCRGLIEAPVSAGTVRPFSPRFPRLYAAASLKLSGILAVSVIVEQFSAALCRGLIEARLRGWRNRMRAIVFRGFMPRPH